MSTVNSDGQWDAIKLLKEWIIAFGKNDTEFRLNYKSLSGGDYSVHVFGVGFVYDDDAPIDGTVTSYQVRDGDGNLVVTVTGFAPVEASEFYAAFISDNTFSEDGRYRYSVALLDDATTATGSSEDDGLEVGAGDDVARGKGGDDTVWKWKSGDLDYDGGKGADAISFLAATGDVSPSTKTEQLVIDLSDVVGANGRNPYGGALTLRSVEIIIGTDAADDLTGNDKANRFGDGIFDTGADRIRGLGGDDRVELADDAAGVDFHGGSGFDTLLVNLGLHASGGAHRLDLSDQENNTGVFENDRLAGFERFEAGTGFYSATGLFEFIGTADPHRVTALGASNTIAMKGGDDVVVTNPFFNLVKIAADGGGGRDELFITRFIDGSNRIDVDDPSENKGIFEDSSYASFEVFRVASDALTLGVSLFEFRGGAAGESVLGIDTKSVSPSFGDDLRGGGGDDALFGKGGADSLRGDSGDDRLDGGRHADTLVGGSGRDRFDFTTALSTLNVDVIADFRPRDDAIRLDNAVFAGLGGTGLLAATKFHIGSKAKDASDRIIYNAGTGDLFHDRDGRGSAGKVKFAELDDGLVLTRADFFVI